MTEIPYKYWVFKRGMGLRTVLSRRRRDDGLVDAHRDDPHCGSENEAVCAAAHGTAGREAMKWVLLTVVLAAAAMAASAHAQPVAPESGDGRYTFHRADDGYLRLDGRTGQVALCNRRPSGWQCQLTPDERGAFEAELTRLQSENALLKKELLSRNLALPNGVRNDAASGDATAQRPQTPDEVEVNRVLNMVEKVWRRLVEMIASVQRDLMKKT